VTTPLSPVCWAKAPEHANGRSRRRAEKRLLIIFTLENLVCEIGLDMALEFANVLVRKEGKVAV
jgi:hypothetical protein